MLFVAHALVVMSILFYDAVSAFQLGQVSHSADVVSMASEVQSQLLRYRSDAVLEREGSFTYCIALIWYIYNSIVAGLPFCRGS